MADVRALLQSERAKRRITHPHATYTSDGKLLCNLCETLVKSEAQWQSHLHSTQHNLRSQRAQDTKENRGVGDTPAGKKRKAESLDSPQVDQTKKRARAEDEDGVPAKRKMAKAKENGRPKKAVKFEDPPTTDTITSPIDPELEPEPDAGRDQPAEVDIDESELQALEADLAALEDSSSAQKPSAIDSQATISAPAMTAEEVAAQAREEESNQKGKRDREMADEREDAERAMEEEFEEMEGLEARVKKLRERREALRVVSPEAEGADVVGNKDTHAAEEDNESDDDDDDFDGWGFGGS